MSLVKEVYSEVPSYEAMLPVLLNTTDIPHGQVFFLAFPPLFFAFLGQFLALLLLPSSFFCFFFLLLSSAFF